MGRIFVQIVVISTPPTLPDVHHFPIPVHLMTAVPLEKNTLSKESDREEITLEVPAA